MKFPLHTIILLCGPSCCGKTFFAKNHLIPGLRNLENEDYLRTLAALIFEERKETGLDPRL